MTVNHLAAAMVALAVERLARIACAHEKEVNDHGMTSGNCRECALPWPCPTYVWATESRDVNAAWDPADDD